MTQPPDRPAAHSPGARLTPRGPAVAAERRATAGPDPSTAYHQQASGAVPGRIRGFRCTCC